MSEAMFSQITKVFPIQQVLGSKDLLCGMLDYLPSVEPRKGFACLQLILKYVQSPTQLSNLKVTYYLMAHA